MSRSVAGHSPGPALAIYLDRIANGELEPDDAQHDAVCRLDALAQKLRALKPVGRGLLSVFSRSKPPPTPPGLYMYGGVGRGKTMLMDLFFNIVDGPPKRRMHFHEFMGEAHDRITAARKTVDGDPIPSVASAIAADAALLCFDELHVTDIADAMILGRLFKGMLDKNVVVVATSNAHPHDLYRNGLNRQLFLPFIDLIEDHLDILGLKSEKDFRLDKLVGHPLYVVPDDDAATHELDAHWHRLTGGAAAETVSLDVKGRHVEVPRAARGVARFRFDELCARPLGAADFLRIAHAFHTVIVDHIPVLTPAKRNEARRFITLIDALYDNRVGLIASAAAEPDAIYPTGDGSDLFQRTASRLMEMRSESYLEARQDRTSARHALS